MNLLFKNKNYTLVFFGFLVSSIGDILFNFAIGLYILDLTHSALSLSIYGAIGGITWIILAPFGGVLTDRWSRVKIIYMTDFIRGLTMLICGSILLFCDDTRLILLTFYITTFIISVNGALFGPASQAIVPMIVEKEELMEANSLMSFMYSVKDIFSLLLAGVLYAVLGPIKIIFINGLSYIGSGISEMFISVNEKKEKHETKPESILKELKEGLYYIIIENRKILLLLVILNGVSLSFAPIQSIVMPYLFNEKFNVPDIHLSLVYVATAIGSMIGSLIVSRGIIKHFNHKMLQYTFISLLVVLGIQGLSDWFVTGEIISYEKYLLIVMLSFVISGIATMLYHIPIYTSVQKLVPEAYYGRVMSLFTMLSSVTMPLSMTVGGYLLDGYGTGMLYMIALVMMSITLGMTTRCKIDI